MEEPIMEKFTFLTTTKHTIILLLLVASVGMTGLFIYIYSFFYYFHRSGMSGILQSSFYFGYMAVFSFAFFLILGSAAFQFSLIFVKYIYSRIKSD